jgi:hypothetical protein
MKITIAKLFLLVMLFAACQEDPKKRLIEQQKEAQKRETVFNSINHGWNFKAEPKIPSIAISELFDVDKVYDFLLQFEEQYLLDFTPTTSLKHFLYSHFIY